MAAMLPNGETRVHAAATFLALVGGVLGVVILIWWLVWLVRTGG